RAPRADPDVQDTMLLGHDLEVLSEDGRHPARLSAGRIHHDFGPDLATSGHHDVLTRPRALMTDHFGLLPDPPAVSPHRPGEHRAQMVRVDEAVVRSPQPARDAAEFKIGNDPRDLCRLQNLDTADPVRL